MDNDGALVARIRMGDDAAFAELVRRYQTRLLRLAETTVGNASVAQEITQDTWLAVVRGVDRFEGRSSFKTWLFHILLNRARSAARREARAGLPDETVDERFDARGAWEHPPEPWSDRVAERIDAAKLAARVAELLPHLPETQRQIVLLRDIEGVPPAVVSTLLDITDGHQRVLLHRGRARLRHLLGEEVVSA